MQPYSICRLEYQFFTIYTFIDLQKVYYDTMRNKWRKKERKKKIAIFVVIRAAEQRKRRNRQQADITTNKPNRIHIG